MPSTKHSEICPGDYEIPDRKTIGPDTVSKVCDLLVRDDTPSTSPTSQDKYFRRQFIMNAIKGLDSEWKTKRGTWPKRLSRALHECKIPYDETVLSQCGQLARQDSIIGEKSILRVTKDLDWRPGTFGDGGSCFWEGREVARELIRRAGGVALQIWTIKGDPVARCWAVPHLIDSRNGRSVDVDDEASVEEDTTEQCWVLFNAYTQLSVPAISLAAFARAFSECNGFTYYRDVHLENDGDVYGLLYINNSKGYVVGSTTVRKISDVDLGLYIECSECRDNCGEGSEMDGSSPLCENCGSSQYCCSCDERIGRNQQFSFSDDDRIYCESCFDDVACSCDRCGEMFHCEDDELTEFDGEYYCSCCLDKVAYCCNYCGELVSLDNSFEFDEILMCESCYIDRVCSCEDCLDTFWTKDLNCVEGVYFCDECWQSREEAEKEKKVT